MQLTDGLTIPDIRLSDPVIYFPVRHHSPACAFQIAKIIERIRPVKVLIEGPENANDLVPLLASKNATMPLAIYATCVRPRKGTLPERFAAYYPFCDYSPELVAIREGTATGAEVKFIDLDYPSMIAAEEEPEVEKQRNLLEERHLRRSALLTAACQRSGARDHDDLWDSLFETAVLKKDPEDFIRDVLAYCALARADASDEELKAEGTLHREAAMADAIREAARGLKKTQRILVVTGGYHTIALPGLVSGKEKHRLAKLKPSGEGDALLIRYNFPQLDRLNGYSSGMPSPEFYQRSWVTLTRPESISRNAGELVVTLARELREKKFPVSPADEIACLDHIQRLARMRRHPVPSREDFLDGVRSIFVKGEHDIEGVHILAQARKLLCGHRIGSVPAGASVPPLVIDFQNLASGLRLDLDAIERKELVLDLYRKITHRQASRMMYRLQFLEIPFANRLRGPDFVAGENLDRIQEAWSYLWEPATEAALVENSLYGSTLEEAALNSLLEKFQKEAATSAALATELLIEACRMGLHHEAAELVPRTVEILRQDPDFQSLVGALGNLITLETSREPLEAQQLDGISGMARQAYELACYRLPDLANVADDRAGDMIAPLKDLTLLAESLDLSESEEALLWNGLRRLDADAAAPSPIHGAATGILFSAGEMSEEELIERLRGYLRSSTFEKAMSARFVEGLLAVARDVIWNVPAVIDELDAFFREVSEDEFLSVVPHLRLAFSALTAREIDRVAGKVREKSDLSAEEAQAVWNSEFTSTDREIAGRINSRVAELLAADHLDDLLDSKTET